MRGISFLTAMLVMSLASAAQAQVYFYSEPVVTYYAPSVAVVPVRTVVRPRSVVTAYYAPAAVALPATTVYYQPTTVRSVRTTTYYAPAPVVYREPVYVASPVVTYSPVYVGRPVVVGRSVIGRPQLYVPGQPVRNTLRFATP